MSKIHITMVGGQQMPIYQGINETNPDKVIIVYSKESASKKNGIERVVRGRERVIECEAVEVEAFNCSNIENKFSKLAQLYKNEEVSVNISGGPKTWTYYAICCFSEITTNIFYIDQNSTLWSFKDKTSYEINNDLCTLFDMNQWPIEEYNFVDDYDEEDMIDIRTIESLWLKNKKAIAELGNELKENGRYSYCSCDGGSIAWDGTDEQYIIQLYSQTKYLQSKKAFNLFTNTSWFEVKIAKLLQEWPHAQNIMLNCRFQSIREQRDKNEIDIIIETDRKAFFIECKTNIREITDIDKFTQATRNYGGAGSKAIFIQYAQIENVVSEKINDNAIIGFSLLDYNNINTAKKELFRLLDREYETSNI